MSLEAPGKKTQAGTLGWQCQNVIGHPCATAQAKVHLSAPQRSPTQQQGQETTRTEELLYLEGPVQPISVFNGVVFSCCLSCFIVYVSSPLLWGKNQKAKKWREPRTEMLLLFQKNDNGSTVHCSRIVAFPKIPLERTVCNFKVPPPRIQCTQRYKLAEILQNQHSPRSRRSSDRARGLGLCSMWS